MASMTGSWYQPFLPLKIDLFPVFDHPAIVLAAMVFTRDEGGIDIIFKKSYYVYHY
jgi:hypothetical protein